MISLGTFRIYEIRVFKMIGYLETYTNHNHPIVFLRSVEELLRFLGVKSLTLVFPHKWTGKCLRLFSFQWVEIDVILPHKLYYGFHKANVVQLLELGRWWFLSTAVVEQPFVFRLRITLFCKSMILKQKTYYSRHPQKPKRLN